MQFLITFLAGYLLGSIPFGFLIVHLNGKGDIREIGSGNIGATNVLRTGNINIALITLFLDGLKAAMALLIFEYFYGVNLGLIAGAAALIGHCYPIWLKFRGGKGVATFFGFLLASSWVIAAITGSVWFVVALISRMSSLAAILAAILTPLIAFSFNESKLAVVSSILAVIIVFRHSENIIRIVKGTESKFGK
jgi:glycerol-3-phosphate acyltransferase PlsY